MEKKKNILKIIYGIFIFIIILISFVLYQTNSIQIKNDFISYIFLTILLVIILLPLAKEVQVFNIIKFKKDFDEFRESVENKLSIIQNTFISSINQNQLVQVITGEVDSKEIRDTNKILQKEIDKISKKRKNEIRFKIRDEVDSTDKNIIKMFNNSIAIEKRLNKLIECSDKIYIELPRNISYTSRLLVKSGIIDKNLYNAISTFVPLRNSVVHGKDLTKEDLQMAIDLSQSIIFILDEVLDEYRTKMK